VSPGKHVGPATKSFAAPQTGGRVFILTAENKPVKQAAHAGESGGSECFNCKSPDHLVRACPLRAAAGRREGEVRTTHTRPGGGAKVNQCVAIGSPREEITTAVNVHHCAVNASGVSEGGYDRSTVGNDVTQAFVKAKAEGESVSCNSHHHKYDVTPALNHD